MSTVCNLKTKFTRKLLNLLLMKVRQIPANNTLPILLGFWMIVFSFLDLSVWCLSVLARQARCKAFYFVFQDSWVDLNNRLRLKRQRLDNTILLFTSTVMSLLEVRNTGKQNCWQPQCCTFSCWLSGLVSCDFSLFCLRTYSWSYRHWPLDHMNSLLFRFREKCSRHSVKFILWHRCRPHIPISGWICRHWLCWMSESWTLSWSFPGVYWNSCMIVSRLVEDPIQSRSCWRFHPQLSHNSSYFQASFGWDWWVLKGCSIGSLLGKSLFKV